MNITILRTRHEKQTGRPPTENRTPACINLPAIGQRIHLDIRHGLKVVAWNVLILLPDGQDSLASLEYNLDLIGLCETRWRDSGEHLAGNYHYVWSDPNDNFGNVGQAGVALAMSRNTRKALISWRPINTRMLEARFEHRHGKLTIIVAYAPTKLAENGKKVAFYELLQDVAGSRSPHDITLVISDTNVVLSLSLEPLALTGRVFLAPHSSTEPPMTMANASCRPVEAHTCASPTPGFRASESNIGRGTAMMVLREKKAIDHIIISRR